MLTVFGVLWRNQWLEEGRRKAVLAWCLPLNLSTERCGHTNAGLLKWTLDRCDDVIASLSVILDVIFYGGRRGKVYGQNMSRREFLPLTSDQKEVRERQSGDKRGRERAREADIDSVIETDRQTDR